MSLVFAKGHAGSSGAGRVAARGCNEEANRCAAPAEATASNQMRLCAGARQGWQGEEEGQGIRPPQ